MRMVKSKYPDSFRIHTILDYFLMFIANKPHKCITEIRGFDFKNPSIAENVL